ncbi:hypothetical protein SAMN04489740_2728 [Arthrobacter alpinus]|uniref:Uncharacterized protein n=1 Tax=Arthrobacter alpinus TaxID=656366 RepID=A0A1H5M3A7_9MICC|nr:hypothetical protein [Arthrobacter alpinus]SEE83693.1 hypothetical protein SAMN04489740_2728 [Arthrobacter alpinus]
MTTQRDDLAREIFIADNSNQPREQSIVDWEWFEETPRYAIRIERYKEMAAALIAVGWTKERTVTTEDELKALHLGDVIHCAGERTGEGDGDQTFTLVLNLAGRPAWRNHFITYSVISVLDDYETITVLREQPTP